MILIGTKQWKREQLCLSLPQLRNLFCNFDCVYPKIQQNFQGSGLAFSQSNSGKAEMMWLRDQCHHSEAASGQEYAYKSIDCILNDDEAVQYPMSS
ncbi:hypothetical protein TNCV_4897101 [Trichonephila clavipes]|nr:hypothetical protein TNCV_4897101 [Trichonephila clavipes]